MHLPMSTKASGKMLGVPDVCKVPSVPAPIPTPFPNQAECALAVATTTKVFVQNMPVLKAGSFSPMSTGHAPGVLGGVVSGMYMGQVAPKTASLRVIVQGGGAVSHTAVTAHNGNNANQPAGLQVAPSQTKVFCAP